jgi:hypothetical protein
VRQVKKQRGAKLPDHPRQCHIEGLARPRRLRLAVDILGGSHKTPARDHNDDDAEQDEGKSGRVGEPLRRARRSSPAPPVALRISKTDESFYRETEGHDCNGGSTQGEKRTFIGGVIAVTFLIGLPRGAQSFFHQTHSRGPFSGLARFNG